MDSFLDKFKQAFTASDNKGVGAKEFIFQADDKLACFSCDAPFTLAQKHHCRLCGRACCEPCLRPFPIPLGSEPAIWRVCDFCECFPDAGPTHLVPFTVNTF